MFYTVRGHNKDRFDKEPAFRTLMLNGILWATHRLEQ
jgi:type 1 glutamine amidotransferase